MNIWKLIKRSSIFQNLSRNPQFKSICGENYFFLSLDWVRRKYSQTEEKYEYKIVKTLLKQIYKIYFVLDSCIEELFSLLVAPPLFCH